MLSCQKITRLYATKPSFIYLLGCFKILPDKHVQKPFFLLLGAILLLENPDWEKFPFIATGKARMTYYILDFTTSTNKKEARN